MTTHELANILLQQEDVPVVYRFLDYDHNDDYYYADMPVNEVHFFKDTVYLVAGDFVSPEEEERRQEEERLFWEEERRKCEEAEAKLPTLKNVLKLVSEEAKDAFILYIDRQDDLERILNNVHNDPAHLSRCLISQYATNARMSKEFILEILHACIQFGIEIPSDAIQLVEKYDITQNKREMFKSETDRRWRETLRNKKK